MSARLATQTRIERFLAQIAFARINFMRMMLTPVLLAITLARRAREEMIANLVLLAIQAKTVDWNGMEVASVTQGTTMVVVRPAANAITNAQLVSLQLLIA